MRVFKLFSKIETFSLNLKGSDNIFERSDYFELMKLIRHIFKKASKRTEITAEPFDSTKFSNVKGITLHLPLAFIRRNLQLYSKNSRLIENTIKKAPFIYNVMIKHPNFASWRPEIITEILTEFLV